MTLRNLGCVRFLQLTSCLEIMLSLLVLLYLIIFIFVFIILLSLLVTFIHHIFVKVTLIHMIIQVIILNILFIFYGMNSGWYHFVDSLGTELEVI